MTRAGKTASPAWLEPLWAGDRAALAKAISAVESEGADARALLRMIYPRLGRAHVVGITGAPGAGKSTLVSAYVGELRKRGKSVGVVAVDPSSPLSGGAILGDRIRMTEHSGDPQVFVRSLASRGHLGGLSRIAARVIDVMDAAGRDVIIVETVGAGQSETEVADIADTKVVVTAPGLGDEIQALKAGILEIADILVVNKADRPEARRTAAQLAAAAGFSAGREGWKPPVLRTSALQGEGIDALADAIERHAAAAQPGLAGRDPRRRVQRILAGMAADEVRKRLLASTEAQLAALCEAVLAGELGFDEAAAQSLRLLEPGGG